MEKKVVHCPLIYQGKKEFSFQFFMDIIYGDVEGKKWIKNAFALYLFGFPTRYKSIMRLNITKIRPQDFGEYNCVVKNEIEATRGVLHLHGKLIWFPLLFNDIENWISFLCVFHVQTRINHSMDWSRPAKIRKFMARHRH